MVNYKLLFTGTETSNSEDHTITCFHNTNDEIFIEIDNPGNYPSWLCLNKATAIKFHRELKKQISFIESEVSNG